MRAKRKASLEREKLKNLHGLKKVQYIWDYYKLPIVVLCIFLYIITYYISQLYLFYMVRLFLFAWHLLQLQNRQ